MKRFGVLWFVLAGLATTQAIAAVVLLYWGFPLFTDQPLLGNGVATRARELEELLSATSNASPRLAGMSEHYRWLFSRQIEGVLASLVASAMLLFSSAVTWVVLLLQPSARVPHRAANGT